MKWELVSCNIWAPERAKLLAAGWEPFAVTGEGANQMLWLRRAVITKLAS